MTDADSLTPANPRDVATALSMALTSGSSLAKHQAAEVTAKVVAERLVAYLESSGLVIMRKPLAGGTSPLHYPDGWPHTKASRITPPAGSL